MAWIIALIIAGIISPIEYLGDTLGTVIGFGLPSLPIFIPIFSSMKRRDEDKRYKHFEQEKRRKNEFIENQVEIQVKAIREKNNALTEEHVQKCKTIFEARKNDLEHLAKECDAQADFFLTQAAETRKALEPLYEQRKTFYSVGIVPPDYRTLDCAYAFDQIFRNDLADTMREAVKIYEERVFRGEIVRGIRSLEQFMGNVSSLLTTLHHDMSAVRSEISHMSQGVSRIYEQQAQSYAALEAHNQELLAENRRSYAALERNQELLAENKRSYASLESRNRELFKETQMSRYALEAIKENNEKLVKYVEDYEFRNN